MKVRSDLSAQRLFDATQDFIALMRVTSTDITLSPEADRANNRALDIVASFMRRLAEPEERERVA